LATRRSNSDHHPFVSFLALASRRTRLCIDEDPPTELPRKVQIALLLDEKKRGASANALGRQRDFQKELQVDRALAREKKASGRLRLEVTAPFRPWSFN